jgi:cytidine deaminase
MADAQQAAHLDPARAEEAFLTSCGVVTAQQALQLEQSWNMNLQQVMFALVPYAQKYAKPTISGFSVGVVALGSTTGNLYFGANMEFSGQALSFTTHAEQSAITNAWLSGEQGVVQPAVSAAPCGYCRQFLYELDTAAQLGVILAANQVVGLVDLLPLPFGPNDLGVTSALMTPANNGLSLTPTPTDPLVLAALAAANASYAPYSKGYAGVAIQTTSGATFAGQYAENAAFNPSMSPMESALTMQGLCGNQEAIERAVLVEAASQADQSGASELVLSVVAPTVALQVLFAS